jgi:hypothetical protein
MITGTTQPTTGVEIQGPRCCSCWSWHGHRRCYQWRRPDRADAEIEAFAEIGDYIQQAAPFQLRACNASGLQVKHRLRRN